MTFELTRVDNKFTFVCNTPNLLEKDFYVFLSTIEKLLQKKKPFSFMVDCRSIKSFPIKCAIGLISWMKKKRPEFKNYLICSSVILSMPKFAKVLNYVFQKQKPIRPNFITNNYEKAQLFIKKHHDEYSSTHKEMPTDIEDINLGDITEKNDITDEDSDITEKNKEEIDLDEIDNASENKEIVDETND